MDIAEVVLDFELGQSFLEIGIGDGIAGANLLDVQRDGIFMPVEVEGAERAGDVLDLGSLR